MHSRPIRTAASCLLLGFALASGLDGEESDSKGDNPTEIRKAVLHCLNAIQADLKDLKVKYPQLGGIEKAEIVVDDGSDEEYINVVLCYEHDVTYIPNHPKATSPTKPVYGSDGINLSIVFANQSIKMGVTKGFQLPEIFKDLFCIVEIKPWKSDDKLQKEIVGIVEKRVDAMHKTFQHKTKGNDD